MDDVERFLTVKEVADWIGVTPQTVRKMIKDKRLYAAPLGSPGKNHSPRYRIPFQAVLVWSNSMEKQ